jgi:hypothetical protein
VIPLVKGVRGRVEASVAALAYVAGSLMGSACTGITCVLIGALAGPLPSALVGSLCLCAAVAILTNVPTVTANWMVPREWARFGYVGYAAAFGATLGAGLITVVPSAGFWALLAFAEAAKPATTAVAVLMIFGLVRGLLMLAIVIPYIASGVWRPDPVETAMRTRRVARDGAVLLLSALGAAVLLPG